MVELIKSAIYVNPYSKSFACYYVQKFFTYHRSYWCLEWKFQKIYNYLIGFPLNVLKPEEWSLWSLTTEIHDAGMPATMTGY